MEIYLSIITAVASIIIALLPIVLKSNKGKLISEEIEEIENPDGSKLKRQKRKFK
jgi:hypothetical protein